MNIRTRLLLSMIPPIVAVLAVTITIGTIVSRNGLLNIKNQSLAFKSEVLYNQVASQWNLLVDFSLVENPVFITAALDTVQELARIIVSGADDTPDQESTDSAATDDASLIPDEVIFAVDIDETTELPYVAMSTHDGLHISPQELAALFAESDNQSGNTEFSQNIIAGEEFAYTSFSFEPFGWTFFLAEKVTSFNRSAQIILRASLVSGALAIALLTILLFILSHSLTRPLVSMSNDVLGVVKDLQNINVTFPYQYRDETGKLALTFNTVFEQLNNAYKSLKQYALRSTLTERQEKRIRTIFQKYVPQKMIDQFIKNPDSLLVGESKKITVLFSDIRGFTTISELLSASELVNFLNKYLSSVVPHITDNGGIVDKFIGDAVMAIYGAPVALDDSPAHAVKSAIQMIQTAKKYAVISKNTKVPKFSVGVGIHYGEAIVGNIGSEQKIDYTAIGDTVNLSSRLEGLCKMYQQEIIISKEVADIAQQQHNVKFVDVVMAKGKTEATRVYTVIGPHNKQFANGVKDYHAAIDLFYKQDFQKSIKLFKSSKEKSGADYLCDMFIERATHLTKNPPGNNWSGVVKLEKK